eukprot:746660-Hanusia_phi.AAC.8
MKKEVKEEEERRRRRRRRRRGGRRCYMKIRRLTHSRSYEFNSEKVGRRDFRRLPCEAGVVSDRNGLTEIGNEGKDEQMRYSKRTMQICGVE